MCGIAAIIGETNDNEIEDKQINRLKSLIDSRGPDYNSNPILEIKTKCQLKLKFFASVLHLRGDVMQKQPFVDEDENVLLYNGQMYKYEEQELDNIVSDTSFLSEKLRSSKSKEDIVETLAAIDGPFAFIYWSNQFQTLFYGRDIFGRKSLCVMKHSNTTFPQIISSVSLPESYETSTLETWSEVDCTGIHCIHFNFFDNKNELKLSDYMWPIDKIYQQTSKCQTIKFQDHIEYKSINRIPLKSLNISDLRLCDEFNKEDFTIALKGLSEKLIQAVLKRLKSTRLDCLKCRKQSIELSKECNHSKVLVAFSGGIDSTLLAFILNKVLPEQETIDLSTVAFKEGSPDRDSVGCAYRELRKLCPKRNWRLILCDISKEKLQEERRHVIANLILPCNTVIDDSLGCGCYFISKASGRAINSSISDTQLNDLLNYNPSLTTINDDNNLNVILNYISPASLIFAGMGIDEQLGGYSSHRASWLKGSSYHLNQEIAFQMRRLSSRNLGRDDRCFSHHGRDVRLPYLDFDLVSYLNQLPVGLKMNLSESNDIGPKKILRELANEWGLEESSKRVKRALQFGTRIANLEEMKEKGNEICSRLRNII